MSFIMLAAATAAISTFVVCTAFPLVFTLKPIYDGSIQFREWPRELLFSDRVQRHCDQSEGWRLERAYLWASFLNRIDPGHIERVRL